MIQRRTKRGRPAGTLGPVAAQVLAILADAPMTAAQVAERLQLSTMIAKYTCSRLDAAGAIRVLGYLRVAGSHRPVSVYVAVAEPERGGLAPSWFSMRPGASA